MVRSTRPSSATSVSVPPTADETHTEPVAVWVRSSGVAMARVSRVSEASVRGAGHPARVAGAGEAAAPVVGDPLGDEGRGDREDGAADGDAVDDVEDEQAVSARPSSSVAGPADLS